MLLFRMPWAWSDFHLHKFEVPHPATGEKVEIGIPEEEYELDREVLPDWGAKNN